MSETRINPKTGVIEEDAGQFEGLFSAEWEATKNNDGASGKIHPETGILEEDQALFEELFGKDWQSQR